MFIHPSFMLFFSFLLFSVIFTISSNSWLFAWIGLEMNLLSFVPIMLKKLNKYSTEVAIKYFLIQTISSIYLLFFLFMKFYLIITLMSVLMLKMGAAPFHQWLPSIVDGLSWPALFILLILQKVNPFILMSFLTKPTEFMYMLQLFIVSSALIGSMGGLNHTSLRKILVFSSISHLSWLLASFLVSNWVWLNYFLIYAFILFSLIFTLHFMEMYSINDLLLKNKTYNSALITLSIMSIGGLPPFSGFVPKFIVMQSLFLNNLYFIMFFLLTSTFVSLFFYARMFLSVLLLKTSVANYSYFYNHKMTIIFMNLSALFFPSIFMMSM
uniref:NADH-ubiquinone oxidoreductase chain 2 n=1 Tax=Pseudoniphargus daviui TaxID=1041814 RepID=K7ZTT1_9CRUS|nr:NADH dehydrogenase subunit 2 [Pseudoniphargus daviui]CCB84628.1 NADH dehydrogenase subunit 2 [Pseudoniphargus daviui]